MEWIKSKFQKKEKSMNLQTDDEEGREEWGSPIDFFMSTLGYAVGVGNVWRFPYLCYKNGGGVFLIPYFLCMIFIGIPLVYLEFTIGQFTSKGPLTGWTMVPIAGGIGYSMNIANSLLIMFYNMIIAYSLYFFVLSLTSKLPWQDCSQSWASANCIDAMTTIHYNKCDDNSTFKCDDKGNNNFGFCFNRTNLVDSQALASCTNVDRNSSIGYWKATFPSQDYWEKVVLQRSSSIDESGTLVWQLVLSLFVAYFLVYLMIVRGIKVSGKLVWFTALFPYVVLLILGIRGWLLPGADVGIRFYVIPDWTKLGDIGVWSDAATQIFFTLSVGYGGLNTLASYNRFNQNILRDAILVPLLNCLTSFFAGFVIFSYLGYLAHVTNQDISNIVQAGQGLAYVVYPYAVTTITVAPLWACLFFLMMTFLGIDSTLGCVEVSLATLFDSFPNLQSTKLRRYLTITTMFFVYFLCGLIFCLNSGAYWIELFNNYAGDWAVLLVGAFECICVAWFYGMRNIRNDLRVMIGAKYTENFTFYIWYIMWGCFTPIICYAVTIVNWTKIKKLGPLGGNEYPDWTLMLGQMMTTFVMCGIVFYIIYITIKTTCIDGKPFLSLFKPDFENFQPKKEANQKLVRIYRGIPLDEANASPENSQENKETFTNLGFDTHVDRF